MDRRERHEAQAQDVSLMKLFFPLFPLYYQLNSNFDANSFIFHRTAMEKRHFITEISKFITIYVFYYVCIMYTL